MNSLLELRGISKRFGETVVFERVSLTLQPGGHLALLGPSGCGKSTLLRLVVGLDTPSDGEIFFEGRLASVRNELRVPPHQRGVAMVFQDLALWPNLTAFENVLLGLAGQNLSRSERRDRTRHALEICELAPLGNRRPAALSIGQQQRVALARAVAVRPKLLLLDEPFSSLDLLLKTQLFEVIQRLLADTGATLVLVTHDPFEAIALTRDVAVLEDGHLSESGPLAELLVAPVSRTLRACARLRASLA